MTFKRLFERGNGGGGDSSHGMAGSLFQGRGAEDEKALSPVRVRVFGTKRQVIVDEHRYFKNVT